MVVFDFVWDEGHKLCSVYFNGDFVIRLTPEAVRILMFESEAAHESRMHALEEAADEA